MTSNHHTKKTKSATAAAAAAAINSHEYQLNRHLLLLTSAFTD